MNATRVIHISEMDRFPDAVYIGRAVTRRGIKASKWGNPFRPGKDGHRTEVMERYDAYLHEHPELVRQIPDLRGKPLACWCRHDGEAQTADNLCHADILARWLDQRSDDELRAFSGAE